MSMPMVPAPTCFTHASAPAVATCGGCRRPICAECLGLDLGSPRCPACRRKARRAARWRGAVVAVAGVALAAAGGAFALRGLRPLPLAESKAEHGASTQLIRRLAFDLELQPCARELAVQYVDELFAVQDWRGVIAAGDAYVDRCGRSNRIRMLTYAAHMRLREPELAARDATSLLEASPRNATYLIWRAQAYEAAGDQAQAIAGYEEALRLHPRELHLAKLLADAYLRDQRPCDALRTLERHPPTRADRPELAAAVKGLKWQLTDAKVCARTPTN